MLNKPKFMKPSTNMQECTIDVSADKIPFSCIIDGNEAINAWQIIIYNLEDDTKVFDTGKVTLGTTFFPVDEKNRNIVFSIDLKEYIGGTSTFINKQGEYYWTITFWGTSGNSTTSHQEVFYANKSPKVNISYRCSSGDSYEEMTNGVVLTSRTCTFKATYEQDEDIGLKRYGWRLIDTNSGQILVDTISNNQVYGTADNIVCTYNGFLNDGNYSIELYIETQNNLTLTTEAVEFSVSYNTTFLSNDFKLEALKNEPAIMLDWNEAIVIGGRTEGEIEFKANYPIIDYMAETPNTSIEIPVGSKVIYDYGSSSNIDIDENCYVVLSAQLLNGNDVVLFDAEGANDNGYAVMRKLSFSKGVFEYIILGANENIASATYEVENQPNQYVWYIIIMAPLLKVDGEYTTNLTVIESKAINGLYPSTTLYPSTSLYPTYGVWDKLKEV